MSCHPGTPCYNGGTTVYPKHCGVDPCHVYKTNTDNTFYNGGNLPCTGVNTCDSLTTVLQKIDDKLCPTNLATAILNVILNNPGLLNQFCTLVSNCSPTTTTTSSTSSTTTTTTTLPCDCRLVSLSTGAYEYTNCTGVYVSGTLPPGSEVMPFCIDVSKPYSDNISILGTDPFCECL
jgi:hypothetical protein